MFRRLFLSFLGLSMCIAAIFAMSGCGESTEFEFTLKSDGTYDCALLSSREETVTVPSEHYGVEVTSFCDDINLSIEDADAVKTIILSEGIESVTLWSLNDLEALEKLVLPSSIKRVEYSNSKGFDIEFDSNEYVEYKSGCFIEKRTGTVTAAENNAVIPDGVKIIGSFAFQRLTLDSLEIPNSVERIEHSAFLGAKVLKSVELELSENIEFVGEHAFYASMDISKFVIATEAPIDAELFGAYKELTVRSIVLDVKPNLVGNGNTAQTINLSGNANKKGVLKYLYISNGVEGINKPNMFKEIDCEINGYKKYDYSQSVNNNGYTVVSFIVSAN